MVILETSNMIPSRLSIEIICTVWESHGINIQIMVKVWISFTYWSRPTHSIHAVAILELEQGFSGWA